jgi:regulator of sigma E protease
MPPVYIQRLTEDRPAAKAGLHVDDAILVIDGKQILGAADVSSTIQASNGKPVSLHVSRDGRLLDFTVQPLQQGASFVIGVEIGSGRMVASRYGPARATLTACRRTWEMTTQIFDVLGRLLTFRLSMRTMAGPLGIAQASGSAARQGGASLFGFIAFVSVNVGLLNLILPLVPLDGGHILLLLIEGIARRDINERIKYWIMNAGLVVVLALIVVVLYSDVSRTAWFGKYLP